MATDESFVRGATPHALGIRFGLAALETVDLHLRLLKLRLYPIVVLLEPDILLRKELARVVN